MLKRLKVWSFVAVAAGASLYQFGCGFGSWLPWGSSVDSWPRIITAIITEQVLY